MQRQGFQVLISESPITDPGNDRLCAPRISRRLTRASSSDSSTDPGVDATGLLTVSQPNTAVTISFNAPTAILVGPGSTALNGAEPDPPGGIVIALVVSNSNSPALALDPAGINAPATPVTVGFIVKVDRVAATRSPPNRAK